ncbi:MULTISPECIES: BrxA/BrxB family bacilliredoxin [Arcicella]|uniref:BrxA/BrxB family bacilliredoxin n=1 Tax=Arcicella aquatica TaxID=217141 RepID=A0ABU5QKU4_9BACT|nr:MULTISPECIES: BrxA/BrxB family bacilliredoxin [Arcicella]MDR6563096.1 putative YphP/YqiW family bacilliredoxin [Arcicella sp. BE51]MDR6811753.1 putative YphP/YqiW family bacilliredoxin [Arcicella sp. BE140]MDR6823278.1 putative YphP/YqiW family bacilliredoxin [Arcicella sp. BE139]MEA5257672.1 BrxA/BrxB family bacilliredoxin [Arcicella aquatica]
MYPEHLVAPMRADIVEGGFTELKSATEVDQVLAEKGTTLVFINSVCGCSARTARPGVKEAVWNSAKKPEHLVTVFAGVDQEATQKVREYHLPYPPSSPSVALFKDGELVHFVERHHIEGRSAEMIAGHLEMVFDEFCA